MEFKEIWETFSKIQKKDLPIAKKGNLNLDYLSWAQALHMAIDHFPDLTFDCNKEQTYEDGTMMVFASVNIGGHTREMWLPVMDHKNNSIVSPSSRQVSDNKMRCLVKCFSLFGLRLNVYAGEDLKYLDEGEEQEAPKPEKKTTQKPTEKAPVLDEAVQVFNTFLNSNPTIDGVISQWKENLSDDKGLHILQIKDQQPDVYKDLVEHRDLAFKHSLAQVKDVNALSKILTQDSKDDLNAIKALSKDEFNSIMTLAKARKEELLNQGDA